MKTLIVIPARGGSKGIPGKNIKLLNGKPLISYTIDAARSVFDDDDICVSTDSQNIIETVEQLGLKVPFVRPDELSTDYASSESVIRQALSYYQNIGVNYEYVILLQPTSPFRTGKHISEALQLINSNVDMVVSVKETAANPYYVLFEENKKNYLKKSKVGSFTRRQDCPKVYELNGAIYIINVDTLKRKNMADFDRLIKYLMKDIESIDIDTPLDWVIAEQVFKEGLK